MSTTKSPVAAFVDRKAIVLDQLVPCAINTAIGWCLSLIGGIHGLVNVLDRAKKGEKIGPTDVLSVAFDDIVNRILFWIPPFAMAFAMGVVIGVVMFIPGLNMIVPPLLSLAYGLVMAMIFPYAVISVAREKTPWLKAWLGAIGRVKSDLKGGGIYMLVTSILGGLGGIAFGVGALVTMPMAILAQLDGFEATGGLGAPPIAAPAIGSGTETK